MKPEDEFIYDTTIEDGLFVVTVIIIAVIIIAAVFGIAMLVTYLINLL